MSTLRKKLKIRDEVLHIGEPITIEKFEEIYDVLDGAIEGEYELGYDVLISIKKAFLSMFAYGGVVEDDDVCIEDDDEEDMHY